MTDKKNSILQVLAAEEAESIMDYVTGTDRAWICVIYQKFCVQAGIQTGK